MNECTAAYAARRNQCLPRSAEFSVGSGADDSTVEAFSRGEHVLLTPREDRIPTLDGLEALNNDLAVVAHLALSRGVT